uniref:Uncharacterized protein n=1 Tax=Arcella intermedia TaxID=1963864 RepID=A0A6B2KYN7_9EUKA
MKLDAENPERASAIKNEMMERNENERKERMELHNINRERNIERRMDRERMMEFDKEMERDREDMRGMERLSRVAERMTEREERKEFSERIPGERIDWNFERGRDRMSFGAPPFSNNEGNEKEKPPLNSNSEKSSFDRLLQYTENSERNEKEEQERPDQMKMRHLMKLSNPERKSDTLPPYPMEQRYPEINLPSAIDAENEKMKGEHPPENNLEHNLPENFERLKNPFSGNGDRFSRNFEAAENTEKPNENRPYFENFADFRRESLRHSSEKPSTSYQSDNAPDASLLTKSLPSIMHDKNTTEKNQSSNLFNTLVESQHDNNKTENMEGNFNFSFQNQSAYHQTPNSSNHPNNTSNYPTTPNHPNNPNYQNNNSHPGNTPSHPNNNNHPNMHGTPTNNPPSTPNSSLQSPLSGSSGNNIANQNNPSKLPHYMPGSYNPNANTLPSLPPANLNNTPSNNSLKKYPSESQLPYPPQNDIEKSENPPNTANPVSSSNPGTHQEETQNTESHSPIKKSTGIPSQSSKWSKLSIDEYLRREREQSKSYSLIKQNSAPKRNKGAINQKTTDKQPGKAKEAGATKEGHAEHESAEKLNTRSPEVASEEDGSRTPQRSQRSKLDRSSTEMKSRWAAEEAEREAQSHDWERKERENVEGGEIEREGGEEMPNEDIKKKRPREEKDNESEQAYKRNRANE